MILIPTVGKPLGDVRGFAFSLAAQQYENRA
jgi:hypothetical protein